MPLGGLIHYFALRLWLALALSPVVLFSASLSLSQLGSSLTEYELSESRIKKTVMGRTVGVMKYTEIEKVKIRTSKWCCVKDGKQTFFFTPSMTGYDECLDYLTKKLNLDEPSNSA